MNDMNASEVKHDPSPAGDGPEAAESKPTGAAGDRSRHLVEWAPVALVAAMIGFAYGPNLKGLYNTWTSDPDYSHGFLVIPISLAIFWRLWPGLADRSTSLIGWGVVALALVARSVLHARGSLWSETATLFPLVVGLGLARLGWPIFRRVWPGFAFLLFLFPLPPAINATLSQPLQKVATVFSVLLLKGTGLWVMAEGNVIRVDSSRLEVQAACNGLAMLMSLAATVVAAASLIPMTNLKRGVLLLSIVPVALLSNVLRITATAWCYHLFGEKVGSTYAHDYAGLLMMPMAMTLVALELWIVSSLIVEVDEEKPAGGLLGINQTLGNLGGVPR
jgi:exosortase